MGWRATRWTSRSTAHSDRCAYTGSTTPVRGLPRARRGEGELLASRAGANGAQWHSVASGGNGFSELSDREIVGQLCAHLDLPNRSDLLPFGIRVRRTYIEAVVAHLWHIWRKFHLGFWGGCWRVVGGGRGGGVTHDTEPAHLVGVLRLGARVERELPEETARENGPRRKTRGGMLARAATSSVGAPNRSR